MAPGSKLSVSGGASIGTGYDTTAAPSDGMIIEGNVGIGTTAPGAKLEVAGNVYANDYFIAAASKWASQMSLQCVQKTLAGSGPDENIDCDSGYTVTGGGCDVQEGGDHSERWWSKPLSNGWSCHANGGVYNVYVICCK